VLQSIPTSKKEYEGYVYVSYGHPKYLKHTIASVSTLRRYDRERPIALACSSKHKQILDEKNLTYLFDIVHVIPEEHASIVGFKHNVYHYMFFQRNLYLDSDIVWCKDPSTLWSSLGVFDFTITGTLVSDVYFGASKGAGVLLDIIFRRRSRTLKRFGLSYLSRVQSGMMYAQDYEITKQVCVLASEMLDRKHETHFRSRKSEQGRTMESCEWSLAMAMSKLNIPVYPWLQGHNSPQLDYIEDLTDHDDEFMYVNCTYYNDDFTYSIRGLKSVRTRKILVGILSLLPAKTDYLLTTPYCLHFGWYHQKKPFYTFSESVWQRLITNQNSNKLLESLTRLPLSS
jgi:hypothetical protein